MFIFDKQLIRYNLYKNGLISIICAYILDYGKRVNFERCLPVYI